MTPRPPAELRELGLLCGIQSAYTDIYGRRRPAAADELLAALQALGLPLSSPADAREALAAERRRRDRELLEPVAVAWRGGRRRLALRLPGGTRRARLRVALEQGGERLLELDRRRLEAGREGTVAAELPRDLPDGYHRLELEAGAARSEALLIRAPRRAWQPARPRMWGVFAPTYALHSDGPWPVGTLAELDRLGKWTAALGGALVATLPLLAAFLDEPCDPSPYSPASRLHWNELFLDLERAGVRESAEAAALLDGAVGRELAALRGAELVDYPRTAALRRRLLEPLCAHLATQRGGELEAFARERPDVVRYARFRAVHERLRRPWGEWPARLRDGELRPGDGDPDAERYHLAVQWLAERQLDELSAAVEERGQLLYFDLPLGVHRDGYDTWAFRDQFALDSSTGAPPDPFFSGGQDWGFAPLHPQASRRAGHSYAIACIRHQLRRARVLRIDHVMGLHRLFWVPRGLGPAHGVYVRYPAAELYAILTLESHRHRALVVGENLGTVPAEVNRSLRRHGLRGMHVAEYALEPAPAPAEPGSLASLNTHDAPPFAAFWHGDDIDDRRDLGLTGADEAAEEHERRRATLRALVEALRAEGRLGADEGPAAVLRAWLERLAAGEAGIVSVTLEDLWLERRPQNVPGTSAERPNWRRRARYSLDDLFGLAEPAAVLRGVERLRRAGGGDGAGAGRR